MPRRRNAAHRACSVQQGGFGDVVRIGEGRFFSAHGTHAHPLVDGKRAGLDNAFLQAPALAAGGLEVQVGIVGTVREDLAQGALEMIGGQAKGLEQDALGSGQTGQGGFAGNHDRIVGTAAALCWPAAPVRG